MPAVLAIHSPAQQADSQPHDGGTRVSRHNQTAEAVMLSSTAA